VRQRSEGYHYRVQASEYVCAWVASLHKNGRADVRWLTSWLTDPWALRELERKLELPKLPFQSPNHLYPARIHAQPGLDWWKWQAARPLIHAGTPLIWIDDDFSTFLDPAVRESLLTNQSVLLIEPDEAIGITAEHIAKVTQFLARTKLPSRMSG
jgi:hypothetical protein